MIEMLRKASVVVLVLAILLVVFGSFAMFGQSIMEGIVYLLVGVAVTLFYAGFIFAFLDMADDIEYIKYKIIDIDHKNNKDKEEIKDGWKCTECGRVNNSYTGTCACGKAK